MIHLDNIKLGEFIRENFHNNKGESVYVLESSQEGDEVRAEYNVYVLGFYQKTHNRTFTLPPEEADAYRTKDY